MAPASWVPAALVVALPSTCADEPPGTTPVRFLDEVAWFEELAIGRPELMSQHDGGIDDPAWQAVVIRPEYREELIADPNATYRTILQREYSLAERMADARWALATSLAFFGSDLLHVGRGVDVTKPTGGLDWHHFLLKGEFPHLPADVRAFARSQELPDPGSCPG